MNSLTDKNTPFPIRPNSAPNGVGGADPWAELQRFTSARIAIGRSGGSQRTPSILDFRLSHARAKDAVNAPFKADELASRFAERGFEFEILRTKISDKASYLMHPDLGRALSDDSEKNLVGLSKKWGSRDFAIVVSDGLSANAAMRHSLAVIEPLCEYLKGAGWSIYPIMLIPYARVKVQDYVGEILGARHSIIFLGERPGLGTPDSLSAYFTFKPNAGAVESDRNCISNIRPEGMPPLTAARKLALLLEQSRKLGLGGISLKDNISDTSLTDENFHRALRA